MKVKKIKKLIGQVRDAQTSYDVKRALDECIRVIEDADKGGKDNKDKKKDKKKKDKKKSKDKDLTIGEMINKMKDVGSTSD